MKLTLTEELFVNGEYVVGYGLKRAKFTIVDEEYLGVSGSTVVNRMICTVREYNSAGERIAEVFGSLIIAMGDSNVSVTTEDKLLRGHPMTKDNMQYCTVELYE